MAASEANKEILWLKAFLGELSVNSDSYSLYSDSQSVVYLAENDSSHARMKHIDLKYHFIQQRLKNKEFQLVKIHTDHNPADILTKVAPIDKLRLCAASIGLR